MLFRSSILVLTIRCFFWTFFAVTLPTDIKTKKNSMTFVMTMNNSNQY